MRNEVLAFSEDVSEVLSKLTDCVAFGLMDKPTRSKTFRAVKKALNALDASVRAAVVPGHSEETVDELNRRRKKYEARFLKFEKAVAKLHKAERKLTILLASGQVSKPGPDGEAADAGAASTQPRRVVPRARGRQTDRPADGMRPEAA